MGKEMDTLKAAKSQTRKATSEETRQGHLVDRYVRTHTPTDDEDWDDDSDQP
jgi:hypothetical protein